MTLLSRYWLSAFSVCVPHTVSDTGQTIYYGLAIAKYAFKGIVFMLRRHQVKLLRGESPKLREICVLISNSGIIQNVLTDTFN